LGGRGRRQLWRYGSNRARPQQGYRPRPTLPGKASRHQMRCVVGSWNRSTGAENRISWPWASAEDRLRDHWAAATDMGTLVGGQCRQRAPVRAPAWKNGSPSGRFTAGGAIGLRTAANQDSREKKKRFPLGMNEKLLHTNPDNAISVATVRKPRWRSCACIGGGSRKILTKN